jgi:ubiquinone/menaquinone biosynthesis C-methylase UbiE
MGRYLLNHFPTHIYNQTLLSILAVLVICLLVLYVFHLAHTKLISVQEGFEQSKPYILKENQNVYDSFYAEVYDLIHRCMQTSKIDLKVILKETSPTGTSSILDIGCGTGCFIKNAQDLNLKVTGVDISSEMLEMAKQKGIPANSIVNGNALHAVTFPKQSFTHVYCSYNSFYQWTTAEKTVLLQNIYHWLKPGGYFCVRIVDPDKIKLLSTNPLYLEKEPEILFPEFKYRVSHTKGTQYPEHYVNEKIQDYSTGHIRENEIVYFIESIDESVAQIEKEGFLEKTHVCVSTHSESPDEWIYVFQKNL